VPVPRSPATMTSDARQRYRIGRRDFCEKHLEANWGIKAQQTIVANGAIKAGESIQTQEEIHAGEGYGVYAGLIVQFDAWEAMPRCTRAPNPNV